VFEEALCLRCAKCVTLCPAGVHSIVGDKKVTQHSKCKKCGKCEGVCLTGAVSLKGRTVTIDEVLTEVFKDKEYYIKSGGGIAISGGEPLMQPRFLDALLKESKKNGLTTAVETCGYSPWNLFRNLLDSIDFIIYDVKLIDPVLHEKYCGIRNNIILVNLRNLAEMRSDILVRVPLIPQITDTDENLMAIGALLQELQIKSVELIPYHAFASDKYKAIGRTMAIETWHVQDNQSLERMKQFLASYNLRVTIGA
jgi:pyruvate formate lyase activating enzyme